MNDDYRKLQSILTLDSELNQIQDLDILMQRILQDARNVVNADAGSIYIIKNDQLHIRFAQNDTKQKTLPEGHKLIYNLFSIPITKKTISGYVAATGEPVNIEDVYTIPKDAPYSFDSSYDDLSGYKTHSNLTVPLKINTGELVGVIQVINAKDKQGEIVPFTEADIPLIMHFAGNAAVALQRARMTRAIILRMISMAQLRDPKETGLHVNRVAGYSIEIYERYAGIMNIDKDTLNRNIDVLRMAAMLHDVGKVAISDLILKKPSKFTDDEYEIMKSHTWQGARLFAERESNFDDVSAEVALNHHENWDGSGYPGYIDPHTGEPLEKNRAGSAAGKKGDEIPLYGRIVSIADVYDALSSRRVYKKAWEEEDVLKEMKNMSGTKFDPDLMDVFFEVLPNIKAVNSKYKDKG